MAAVNFRQLKRNLGKQAAKAPALHSTKKQEQRDRYLRQAFTTGGKGFLRRVKKYGTTENGQPLIFRNHYCEYLLLLGDYRLNWILTTGSAQVGKTLGHTFLLIDTVVCGKLNGAWFYDSKTSLDQYAPMQFRPIVKTWVSAMLLAGYKMRLGGDREVNTNYQVDGANAIFSFVSTSKMSRADAGGAAAAAAASSFAADMAVMEERSQYPSGSADVCLDRLANSIVSTRPRRDLGTSGGGLGIEADMLDCHYYFYPHYDCSHCGGNYPLDPKGCLLKEVERVDLVGKKIKSHLSETGRPIEWHHHDPLDAAQSAYIACSKCAGELSDQDRLDRSRYRCTQTGVFLQDFLEALPAGEPERALKVGLHMSPLTREGKARSIAVDIIRRGLATTNPANWQQQVLGHYSRTDTLKLTHVMIRDRIGALLPAQAQRRYRLAGCDIGRGEDWLFIFDIYLPPHCNGLTVAQIAELSIRNVIYAEAVVRSDIPTILETWQVDFGLVDNEPSIESVMGLTMETCLQMANQVAGAKASIKHTVVNDGGVEYPCWSLRNQKFMLAVFEGFTVKAWDGEIRYRVPQLWEKWLTDASERSPIVHLTAPWRDTSDHWHRGKNNLDDFYMAALFAEAALYLKLTEDFSDDEQQMLIDTYTV